MHGVEQRGRQVLIISDSECIRRCSKKDVTALGILVERYEQPLRAVLQARRIRYDFLDDVIQDAFLRAFAAAGRKSQDHPVFPWLVGIAVRVAWEFGRRCRDSAGKVENSSMTQVPAAECGSQDCDGALLSAVEGLPEPFRTTLMLRYFGEFSCVQIAEQMSAPLGTVTKRISRALQLLRDALVTPTENTRCIYDMQVDAATRY